MTPVVSRRSILEEIRDRGILACEVLEVLPVAIYVTDAAGRLTYYNAAAADLWGWRPTLGSARWCGSWRLYWLDGKPLPHDQCPMAVAIQGNRQVRGVEAQAERPDGARIPFVPFPTPLRDADGKLIGAINMLVDISESRSSDTAQHPRLHARLWRKQVEHHASNLLMVILPLASKLREDTAVPRRHPSSRARALALQLMKENGFDTEPACSHQPERGAGTCGLIAVGPSPWGAGSHRRRVTRP